MSTRLNQKQVQVLYNLIRLGQQQNGFSMLEGCLHVYDRNTHLLDIYRMSITEKSLFVFAKNPLLKGKPVFYVIGSKEEMHRTSRMAQAGYVKVYLFEDLEQAVNNPWITYI